MTRVLGPSRDQLDALGDDYAGLIAQALATVVEGLSLFGGLSALQSFEDMAALRGFWGEQVEKTLLPALGVGFEVGAATIRVALREAAGLTAAAFTDVPPTSDALADAYLAQARNRLVRVGDELWAHAREELLEGLRQGEGTAELAARVRKVAPDLTEPRAEVIARTEVLGAVNAGALAQVRATGATGTKEWIAADDQRTRHTHDLADEQTVPLAAHFTVGGFPMDRPHDPAGPPQEVISCRCALGFDLDFPDVEPADPDEGGNGDGGWQASQEQDRSFLERVFAKGLAFMARLFRVQTAAAMLSEREFEPEGGTVTAAAPDQAYEQYVRDDGSWQRVLTVEGKPTGDGRQFDLGALRFADTPLPLSYQPPTHGGVSTDGKIAGRIDQVWKVGEQVWGRGVHDLAGEDGREAHRLVKEGFLPGISVDVDDTDVELVFADELSVEPERMLIRSGRIRGAALVTIPAFVEATLDYEPASPTLAASAVSLDDYRPPADWFTDPALAEPTGIVVTDAGRIYGHAALSTSCHIGFGEGAGQCVTPPVETDHPYFLTGEVLCADGSRVAVGQVTLGTGHAPLSHGAHAAAEHYDHTGSVVADVTCGNDEHGIWVAGAVRPNVDASRVHELRASGQLSGDWRRIGGQLRLVALLAVNVPGFPVPRPRARVASGDPMALVAAGKVAHEAGHDGVDLRPVKERIAVSIGRDRASRQRELAARVKAGRS